MKKLVNPEIKSYKMTPKIYKEVQKLVKYKKIIEIELERIKMREKIFWKNVEKEYKIDTYSKKWICDPWNKKIDLIELEK